MRQLLDGNYLCAFCSGRNSINNNKVYTHLQMMAHMDRYHRDQMSYHPLHTIQEEP